MKPLRQTAISPASQDSLSNTIHEERSTSLPVPFKNIRRMI